jgi:hypothetical protein
MKVWNYMMIMLVLMIFLPLVGMNVTGGEDILSNLSISINNSTGEVIQGDVSNSGIWNLLFNPLDGFLCIAGLVLSVSIGILTRTFDWKLSLIGFFTAFVIKFGTMGWNIVQYSYQNGSSWVGVIVATIFLPLSAMFIFSLVEWFAGGNE